MPCCPFAISSQTQTSSGSPHVGQIPAILDLVLLPHHRLDAGDLLAEGFHSTGALATSLGGDLAALDHEFVLELAQLGEALVLRQLADLLGFEQRHGISTS